MEVKTKCTERKLKKDQIMKKKWASLQGKNHILNIRY